MIIKKLKKVCYIRWLLFDYIVEVIFDDFEVLMCILRFFESDVIVCGLLKKIYCFKFVVCVYF